MFRGYVFKALLTIHLLILAGFSAQVQSEQLADVDAAISSGIIAKLTSARPDLKFGQVSPSPLAGIYQVPVIGGPTLYVAENGEFFFDGDMYEVTPTRYVNLREQAMIGVRSELLAAVDVKDMIIFAPEGETKGVINVFTDVDCGYCRKLHREVPELNRRGIEVRYLAFPRAGVGSPSADKLVSAWCSDTPGETLTELKNGASVESKQCADNPVADQYLLGQKMGVNGTPALVLADGVLIPGYRPAADLVRLLGVE
ncbi:MAG TPA: protein-disulfide isomerase [Porticoccaceae bacterium]|nr:protein-disulfide isomerase [Porticoccaceae bacterium]